MALNHPLDRLGSAQGTISDISLVESFVEIFIRVLSQLGLKGTWKLFFSFTRESLHGPRACSHRYN